MQRVPHAANAVLVLVVATCLSGVAAATPLLAVVAQAATVAWPPSSLVVSEVQTGGAGASDEFVEVANQGAAPIDLIGLEIVYATSSGSTVTRKATWAVSAILAPGRRFLLVNGAGVLAPIGDAVYTGGFAATGGSVALRVVGGSVVDSVGWGDATNAFVEGVAAPAPAAGSSLERRPGGALGNGVDSNDNLADWTLSTAPGPQGLTAPPVPGPWHAVAEPDRAAITDAAGHARAERDGHAERHAPADGRTHPVTDARAHPHAATDPRAHARRRPRRRWRSPTHGPCRTGALRPSPAS